MAGKFDPEIEAVIGDLEFKPEFADPDVELSHDRETVDHEIVAGHTAYRDEGIEYVVQAMGRNAPNIDVVGWVTKEQLETVDELLKEPRVEMTTARWTGVAVPVNIDTNYNRVFHDKHGWIYETTIELLGTDRDGSIEEDRTMAERSARSRGGGL